jgi:hypothetical protein
MYPVPDALKTRFAREISVMIVLKYGCFQAIDFRKDAGITVLSKKEAKMSGTSSK